jgi:hypothetical protein
VKTSVGTGILCYGTEVSGRHDIGGLWHEQPPGSRSAGKTRHDMETDDNGTQPVGDTQPYTRGFPVSTRGLLRQNQRGSNIQSTPGSPRQGTELQRRVTFG